MFNTYKLRRQYSISGQMRIININAQHYHLSHQHLQDFVTSPMHWTRTHALGTHTHALDTHQCVSYLMTVTSHILQYFMISIIWNHMCHVSAWRW